MVHELKWRQIQNPKCFNADRFQFHVNKVLINMDPKKIDKPYIGSVVAFYNKVLKEKLRNIEGFSGADISEGHLLRNRGDLVEQQPHKNYEASLRGLLH